MMALIQELNKTATEMIGFHVPCENRIYLKFGSGKKGITPHPFQDPLFRSVN